MTNAFRDPTRRILIVRRENIGDLILTTPLIASIRARAPQAHVAALVNSYNAAVLRGNPHLDALHVYTKAKHADGLANAMLARVAQVRLWLDLRAMRFHDVVLAEPTYSPRNIRLAKFILGGRRGGRIIGFEGDQGESAGLDWVGRKQNMDGLNQAEIIHRLVGAYVDGDAGAEVAVTPPCLVGAGPAEPQVVPTQEHRIGIHISARKPSQRWATAHFVALIQRLLSDDPHVSLHLFWSPGATDNALHPGDDSKAAAILREVASPRLTPVPTLHLDELIHGLSQVGLVVCADGGAMHIAAGLGKPIVALFGDSDPVRWHPWGVPHRVLQGPTREVDDLTVDAVHSALQSLRSG